ncbi:ATP-binding protein [Herbidospora yilanensis]|uniref:ATP-binding protein n=1 Tax=Herbidospora yilanensis TaxID=354426 RepID=UPI0007C71E43|nr:ATP-binding protein [Herbidospora yilanensis]
MSRVTVRLGRDHLAGQIRSAVHGLAELIWNALDADATVVDITVDRDSADIICSVLVEDDGHGMTQVEAERDFGALGESWKPKAVVSRNRKRALHGSQGKGRYAAFGIGDTVVWKSVATHEGAGNFEIAITGVRERLDEFEVSSPIAVVAETGTRVSIDRLGAAASLALERPGVLTYLTTTFALYLESYPLRITWQGLLVAPRDLQEIRKEYPLSLPGAGAATLVVIEWRKKVRRLLYLCDANGQALHEMQPNVQAPGFDFTAYVRWDGFRHIGHDILLADMEHEATASIVQAARDTLKAHFRARVDEKRQQMVTRWKAEQSYPFSGPPADSIEERERELFDVVALSAAKPLESSDRQARRLALRLLKEALETKPTNLKSVLSDVLELSDEQVSDLAHLLQRAPLTSVIVSARTIADRLNFLDGLDALLFDAEPRRQTLERRQLHRILAEETWLFGEEYALTGDDDRLLVVLRKHLAALGEDVELAGDEPITRLDGTEAIPDLVLSRPLKNRDNRLEHLVVELKRPKVKIGRAELQQIEDYAFAVAQDERFNQPNVHWEFWIIGNELDDYVREEATSPDRPVGVVKQTKRYRVIAKTWAEAITDAKHRLKFVADSLQHRSSRDEGIEYLRRVHARLLPPALREPEVRP